MCGIVGLADGAPGAVEEALELIAHRGPDARGICEVQNAVHGHVRLAIQDPDPRSDQPFRYEDVTLSYVGEIWNRDALRRELEADGLTFSTAGDTEVVAAAVYAWGTAAPKRLEGMFSFAATTSWGTFLARDRFGKIPLYVEDLGLMGIRWASERRALGPDAKPLPAGTVYDVQSRETRAYYQLEDALMTRPLEPPAPWVLDTLRRSTRDRLLSDVPVCALLSGGLDSTLTALLAREVYPDLVAYTVVFDEDGPDLEAARRVSAELDWPLREVRVPPVTQERIREAISAIELPYKVQVEIALVALPLAQAISADGFRVCVCGDGADELFGGYGSLARKATSDVAWMGARRDRIAKMARADFPRLNKAFMRYGVEPRTPFLDRQLVETVLGLSLLDCPPGKGLLKEAARDVLPAWLISRQKETFQGGCGVAQAAGQLINGSAVVAYNEIAREAFGVLPRG